MKVSRKVGRRKHSRGSSISRRRFRNNKNKKSSYKKRYAKTHRGGCWSGSKVKKGGARSRKYGHKRGKRFHRGGVDSFGSDDDDISASYDLPPTISIPNLDLNQLPKHLRGAVIIDSSVRMEKPLFFEYKRTDRVHALNPKSETGVFDVFVLSQTQEAHPLNGLTSDTTFLQGIYLVRHDKNNMNMSDKYLTITRLNWRSYDPEKSFTGIKGYKVDVVQQDAPLRQDGTYTFPTSDTNRQSFQVVRNFLTDSSIIA